MDRGVKVFLGLIVCTLVAIVPLLQVSVGWWSVALPLMVVREWKPTPPPNPWQVTANVGSNVDPAWSPDSWHLAFASNCFGNWSIWTVCEDGSKLRQLTANNTISRYPAWSPDGNRIAYLSHVKGQWDLWVMRSDGTEKVNLTNDPAEEGLPQWSPDGKLILFTKKHPHWNIWITCGDGAHKAQLTSAGDNLYPSWGSDSKRIIYSSNQTGRWDVWLMNADGANKTRLTKEGNNIKPRLSPDRKQIIWLSDWLGGWHIWSMYIDGGIPFLLVRRWQSSADLTISSFSEDADPAWSPDGINVAFQTYWINITGTVMFREKGAGKSIFITNSIGTELTAITGNLPYIKARMGLSNETQAVWSLDSGKIAFVSDCSGNLDIWIFNRGTFTAPTQEY